MSRPRPSLHRKKIGEILLEHDLVQADQITKALKEQLLSGLRLGTILVQGGHLVLDDLGRCLSIQHGIPVATSEMLDNIDPEAIKLLSAKTCQQHNVLPLRVEDNILYLAMLDPDRSIAGAVSFDLGMAVRRNVIPELGLAFHLETHYQLKRSTSLLRSHRPALADTADRRSYIMDTVQAMMRTDSIGGGDGVTHRVKMETPHPVEAAVNEAWDTLLEPTDEMGTDPEEAFQSKTPILTHRRSDLVIEMLAGAKSGREVAEALVSPMFESSDLSVLFIVRESFAVGYMAGEAGKDAIDRLVVSLANMSLLQMANQTRSVVRARSLTDAIQDSIAFFFSRETGQETCVAPLVVDDQVVYLLCLQSQPGEPFPKSAQLDLARVMREAALAIGRLGQVRVVEDLSKEQLKAMVFRLQESLDTAVKARDAMTQQAMKPAIPVEEAKARPLRNRVLVCVGIALAITGLMFMFLKMQQQLTTGIRESAEQIRKTKTK